jgi:hypothetical protein
LGGCCDTLPWRGGAAIPVRKQPSHDRDLDEIYLLGTAQYC